MKPIIKTSQQNWLEHSLQQYSNKTEFEFIDDANIGLTPKDLASAISLIKASKTKAKLSVKSIMAALVGLGLSASGVWIIILAIADPEPTTKLGLLIGGGFLLAFTGGYGTLRALGVSFSVTAKKGDFSFHIKPE